MICPWCDANNLPGADLCVNCVQDLTQLDRPFAHDRVERSLMDDSVAMIRPVPAITVTPETTLREAVRIMLAYNVGALLVDDAAGHLIGIFTERDLLLKIGDDPTEQAGLPVHEFMTRRPETIRESDSLAFALHKMDCGGYRHLPVLRDGLLLGVISVRDLLHHVTRMCQGAGPADCGAAR
jgi:CBS domain-containing protein